MIKYIEKLILVFSIIISLPALKALRFFYKKLRRCNEPKILFGTDPIINNKYWAEALREKGIFAQSVVIGFLPINRKSDFDIVIEGKVSFLYNCIRSLVLFDYFCIPFSGAFFRDSRFEPYIYKFLGIKTIVFAYGSDVHAYDSIRNLSYSYALGLHYPQGFKSNSLVKARIERWQKHGDFVSTAMFVYQHFYRIDIAAPNILHFPISQNPPKLNKGAGSERVCVVHSPNHRFIKGTEFILRSIKNLKEKYDFDFILLEGMSNDDVLDILKNKADIFVEKLIGPSYALSAIEAMSFGVPVISSNGNDDWVSLNKFFGRYSFLNECPIIPANVESFEAELEKLICSKSLRDHYSHLGYDYVQKYHSYEACYVLFNEIFRYLNGDRGDLKLFYHPLIGDYEVLWRSRK